MARTKIFPPLTLLDGRSMPSFGLGVFRCLGRWTSDDFGLCGSGTGLSVGVDCTYDLPPGKLT